MLQKSLLHSVRVQPGALVRLRDFPTDWTTSKEAKKLGKHAVKDRAHEVLEKNREELAEAQQLLYASDTKSVLIVFQAMDAAGKDSTIRHVMSGVNPQGCQVFSFKKPSAEEFDHNFLWRHMKALPERGRIGIFNRSYYEDVLVVKVHPEYLGPGMPAKPDERFWQGRYEDINAFERHLTRSGTVVLKFFLHVSKAEQRERFLDRLKEPDKHWKFSAADMVERSFWKDYQRVYEEAITATSTSWAPWHIIPADKKYIMRALVSDIIVSAIEDLDLRYPEVSKEDMKALDTAKKELEAEGD